MAELRKIRNIKPGFKKGLWFGLANAAWETVTGGLSPWTLQVNPDWCALEKFDGETARSERAAAHYITRDLPPRDRLAGVQFAATEHDEDQPVHLIVHDTDVCVPKCAEEYGNPCTRFCPAAVYEIVEDASAAHGKRLPVNAANCAAARPAISRIPTRSSLG